MELALIIPLEKEMHLQLTAHWRSDDVGHMGSGHVLCAYRAEWTRYITTYLLKRVYDKAETQKRWDDAYQNPGPACIEKSPRLNEAKSQK